jgi:hypothetical protein
LRRNQCRIENGDSWMTPLEPESGLPAVLALRLGIAGLMTLSPRPQAILDGLLVAMRVREARVGPLR